MKVYFLKVNDVLTVNGSNNILDVLFLLSDKSISIDNFLLIRNDDSYIISLSKKSENYMIESSFYLPDNFTLDGKTFNCNLNLYDFILKFNKVLKLFLNAQKNLK